MWELDHKEGWVLKNQRFWTVVLETLESLGLEIKPVNPKRTQSWIFIRRTDAKTEAPILWPPDVKSRLIGKDPDAGKDWRQEEKGVTEDEMAGWHHRLDGHEFEQALGDGEGQGSLACCSPWGHRVKQVWATEQSREVTKWGCYSLTLSGSLLIKIIKSRARLKIIISTICRTHYCKHFTVIIT